MIKGAIFDLDGTLIDSLDAWRSVGDSLLWENGITPPKNLHESVSAMSLEKTFFHMRDKMGLAITQERFFAQAKEIISRKYMTEVTLKPHVLPFLQALEKRGVCCCVATASHGEAARAVLAKYDILKYFRFVLTCEDVGYGKDEPEIFLAAAQRLGTPVGETVVFEDAVHAVHTAKAAGFRVAALYDVHHAAKVQELQGAADYFFHSFAQCDPDSL